jgi:dTDP-4-dehydrorhamnose reductase
VTTILLLGKTGQVGHELLQTLAPLGTLLAPSRGELDLAQADSIRATILSARPDVIVNAAGYTSVDAAQAQPELAMQLNAIAPGIIAEITKQVGALLIHYSTTFVFDGAKREPYTEVDPPNPINAYGRSKLAAEQAIQAAGCDHIILRANWTYSSRRSNFVLKMLELARSVPQIRVVDDQTGAPTWARAYAAATAAMLANPARLREHSGVYNLSAAGQCTRYLWAERIIEIAKTLSGTRDGWAELARTATRDFPVQAPRPLYTLTNNRKIHDVLGVDLAPWDTSLSDFMADHYRSVHR